MKKISSIVSLTLQKAKKMASQSVPLRKYGNHGRLIIPALKIDVPLFESANGNAQKIVDAKRSAAFIRWGSQSVIADHVHEENFKNLRKALVGIEKAYIEYESGKVEKYICTKKQTGHIVIGDSSNKMYDSEWKYVGNMNSGGLTIYTCLGMKKGNVQDVTLTFWRKIS